MVTIDCRSEINLLFIGNKDLLTFNYYSVEKINNVTQRKVV